MDGLKYRVEYCLSLGDVSRPNYIAPAPDSIGAIFDFGRTSVLKTVGGYDLYRQDLSQNTY